MPSSAESKVLELINEDKDAIIDCLVRFLRFRTVTPLDGESASTNDFVKHQDMVADILKQMRMEVETFEIDAKKLDPFPGAYLNRERDMSRMPVVVGTMKGSGGGRSLILNGHYDVVPVGDAGRWKHDPFSGRVENGRVYGRGSCDMKGGIAAMLQALRLIREAGVRLKGDVIVQVVPDEEATCMGTFACCQRGYGADAAIIPEPTNMNVLIAMCGNLSGTITVPGRAGHADLVQPHWREGGAVNAITKSMKILQGLEELRDDWRTRPDKRHKYLDPDRIIPTQIAGGHWGVAYPEEVKIAFNANFLPGTTGIREEIEEKIRSICSTDPWLREHPPGIETDSMYGAETDENEPIVQESLAAARDVGLSPELVGWGTLSDAIHLVNYSKIPTISFGPNDLPAHTTDEYVTLDELLGTTRALAVSIMRWCGNA